MKKSKKKIIKSGFSLLVFVVFLCSLVLFLKNNIYSPHYKIQKDKTYAIDVKDVKGVNRIYDESQVDYLLGYCISEVMMIRIEVLLNKDMTAKGKFFYDGNSYVGIALRETNVNIISHEVSHYVDYIVKRKNINDGETRAYLQGYFTQCVYDLVSDYNSKNK